MMAVPLLLAGLCCLQQLAWADAAAPEKPHIIFFMVVRSRRSRSVACSLPIPPCAPQQRAAAQAAPKPDLQSARCPQDDWGWNDVGYHRKESGAPPKEIQTPHIDQLVSEGVELDRHCGCCTELLRQPPTA
jgi:hypothetical protein